MTEDKSIQFATQAYAISATEVKGGESIPIENTKDNPPDIVGEIEKNLDGSKVFRDKEGTND